MIRASLFFCSVSFAAQPDSKECGDMMTRLSELYPAALLPLTPTSQRAAAMLLQVMKIKATHSHSGPRADTIVRLIDAIFDLLPSTVLSVEGPRVISADNIDPSILSDEAFASAASIHGRLGTADPPSAEELNLAIKVEDFLQRSIGELRELCVARALLGGFDFERFKCDCTSMYHPNLTKKWLRKVCDLATEIPDTILQEWDAFLSITAVKDAELLAGIYSLNEISAKVEAVKGYLQEPQYSIEMESAISSIIVWNLLLVTGRGSAEELSAAATALASVDLRYPLLLQRETYDLFVPEKPITLAEFKKSTNQREMEEGIYDNPYLRQIVMLESRLAALRLIISDADSYVSLIQRMQSDALTSFLKGLDTAVQEKKAALPAKFARTLEDLTIAITRKTVTDAEMLVKCNPSDPRFERERILIRAVTELQFEKGLMMEEIHRKFDFASLPYRLTMAGKLLAAAGGVLSPLVEGTLGNLGMWLSTVSSGDAYIDCRREMLTCIQHVAEEHSWAFIGLRRRRGMPILQPLKPGKLTDVVSQVKRFLALPANKQSAPLLDVFYKVEEADAAMRLSLYSMVMAAVPKVGMKLAEAERLRTTVKSTLAEVFCPQGS